MGFVLQILGGVLKHLELVISEVSEFLGLVVYLGVVQLIKLTDQQLQQLLYLVLIVLTLVAGPSAAQKQLKSSLQQILIMV